MRFENKVVLITGSARGIGRAMAEAFLKEGARVMLSDIDESELVKACQEISYGPLCSCCTCDVTRKDDVHKLVQETLHTFHSIDILVNNAGIIIPAMLNKMTEEEWDRVVDVHLKGSFFCTQAVGTYFIHQAKESPGIQRKIVNITSIAGLRGTIGQINYSAAKAGLLGLTMSAARELGKYQVNVNAVAYGVVETRMTEKIRKDEKLKDIYLNQIVLGRFAEPKEVIHPVLFLSSEEASYITGQILTVDGGMHIGV